LPIYLSSKNLKPFIPAELAVAVKEPVIYTPLHGGKTAYGLKAEFFPQICELIRGLARVGIIALIDEATGYQYIDGGTAKNLGLEVELLDKDDPLWKAIWEYYVRCEVQMNIPLQPLQPQLIKTKLFESGSVSLVTQDTA
jgi:hypothetical protein